MNLVTDVGSLAGVMALIVLLVNALKQFGLVKDGQATRVAQVLQAVAVIALVGLQLAGVEVEFIDKVASNVASLGVALLALVPLLMNLNSIIHEGVKGVPVVGYSYSLEREKHK